MGNALFMLLPIQLCFDLPSQSARHSGSSLYIRSLLVFSYSKREEGGNKAEREKARYPPCGRWQEVDREREGKL
ncbi:hypothetical protein F4775DRAFT_572187, partial [Biscogniauxia sp. FL1348]